MRANEHKTKDRSPIFAHTKGSKHRFAEQQFKILDTEHRWRHHRSIKEAICINAAKPDLNQTKDATTYRNPTYISAEEISSDEPRTFPTLMRLFVIVCEK